MIHRGYAAKFEHFLNSLFLPNSSLITSIKPKEGLTHSVSSTPETPSVLTNHIIQAHVHLREGKASSRSILKLQDFPSISIFTHLVHDWPSCYFKFLKIHTLITI